MDPVTAVLIADNQKVRVSYASDGSAAIDVVESVRDHDLAEVLRRFGLPTDVAVRVLDVSPKMRNLLADALRTSED